MYIHETEHTCRDLTDPTFISYPSLQKYTKGIIGQFTFLDWEDRGPQGGPVWELRETAPNFVLQYDQVALCWVSTRPGDVDGGAQKVPSLVFDCRMDDLASCGTLLYPAESAGPWAQRQQSVPGEGECTIPGIFGHWLIQMIPTFRGMSCVVQKGVACWEGGGWGIFVCMPKKLGCSLSEHGLELLISALGAECKFTAMCKTTARICLDLYRRATDRCTGQICEWRQNLLSCKFLSDFGSCLLSNVLVEEVTCIGSYSA